MHEQENIPAAQDQKEAHPRISDALQNQERARHPAPQTGQGPRQTGCLAFLPHFRIRKREQFLACYESGRRYHAKSFLLFVLRRPEGEKHWRLGLAVTRKVGNAVVRNRIKRVLREFFRLHQDVICLSLDIVVVAKKKPDAGKVGLDAAKRELLPLLDKIHKDFSRVSAAK